MQSEAIGKTALAQRANINYVRLGKLLEWLDERGLIEYLIRNGKVKVKLTEVGRKFASVVTRL